MDINRVENVAKVGMFFVEVVAIVNGESCLRKITSKPVEMEGLERFEQINENLERTGEVPTLQAIRQMKDGKMLENWFADLFNNFWPFLGKLCNHIWYQITEEGICQVEVK